MPSPSAKSTSVQVLPVTDLRRARAWYADVLRATSAESADGVIAFLGTRARLIAGAEPPRAATAIAVADCRSTYEALRERGVHFMTEPIERGSTRCTFRDPDGNRFELRELRG